MPPPGVAAALRISVLTNSSRYALPLGAGLCYLVEGGDARVLLDCAHGADGALLARLGGEDLDAIVLRHYHPETVADVLPVAREFRPRLLFVPQEARDLFVARGELARATVVGVSAGTRAAVQRLRFAFGPADHGCPAVSVRLETAAGAVAYVGDTGPVGGLAEFVSGAALLIAHTLLLDAARGGGAASANLTAGEAGRLARQAGARRLALAHVPFYDAVGASVREATRAFGGEVVAVREGDELAV